MRAASLRLSGRDQWLECAEVSFFADVGSL